MFVMPRLSPYLLGILCMLMFIAGVWQHYSMFPYEYRGSMVTDMLREYSGFIMTIAIIFTGLIVFYMFNGTTANSTPMSLIPDMSTPMFASNNSKSIFNTASNSVSGALNSASKTMTNLMKPLNRPSNSLVSPSFKIS